MQITLNGEPRDTVDGLTVAALLGELELQGKRLAVEVNEDVVPRSEHPRHVLRPGDRVEIVHNGRVVKTIAAEDPADRIDFEESMHVEGPGWLVARAYPPTGQSWWGQPGAAHTSPIYLRAGDRRLIKPDSVNRLIQVLQEGKRRAASSRMYKSGEQKQEVLDFYDAGIGRYQALLESAE